MIKILLLALLFNPLIQACQSPNDNQKPNVEVEDIMSNEQEVVQEVVQEEQDAPHPYVGMWVTENGHVRHELLPNGRYDEARGDRESAYQGKYIIEGDHIEYVDDTGFTADGDFIEGVLYHGGMILYRKEQ